GTRRTRRRAAERARRSTLGRAGGDLLRPGRPPLGGRSAALGGKPVCGEQAGELVVERPLDVDQVLRRRARPLEQGAVGAQLREAKVGEPRLPGAEQLPLAAQLEIDL